MADDEVVGNGVQRIGGDSWRDRCTHRLYCARSNLSGQTDAFDFLCGVDVVPNMVGGRPLSHIFRPDDRVGDMSWGAHDARGEVS